MSSLEQRIEDLQRDLLTTPMRISAYHDLPFTILRYDPREEFPFRKHLQLLATRLKNAGKCVHVISLARLLWKTIEKTEGIDGIVEEEEQLGFLRAQETVSTLLSDEAFLPLPKQLQTLVNDLNPEQDIVFLVRVGALAPAIYRSAKLLDEMHGRTMVPMVLCYPGTLEGENSLRFMGLPERAQTGAYNYRVKIY